MPRLLLIPLNVPFEDMLAGSILYRVYIYNCQEQHCNVKSIIIQKLFGVIVQLASYCIGNIAFRHHNVDTAYPCGHKYHHELKLAYSKLCNSTEHGH